MGMAASKAGAPLLDEVGRGLGHAIHPQSTEHDHK
ncbi:hypothetical protein NBRC3279_2736 [Acetobacter pasteurianus NBRC 3279]|nr:hypothetical protein NBRC3279_2736 [Acetobacter pasteurianus NBRC 3279]GCD73393.1 hypothetical protein NBRC3284_2549 [Acetobacter pasteurianus NBRC 3284]